MKATDADSCVFRYPGSLKECLIVALHVDDGLTVSCKKVNVKEFLKQLVLEIEITTSTPSMYLGIYLTRLPDGLLLLDQKLYTEQLIKRFNMTNANTVATPADNFQEMNASEEDQGKRISTKVPYREAKGGLLFLATVNRPDITFAVYRDSQFCEDSRKIYWKPVKSILKYLEGTKEYSLKFSASSDKNEIRGYSDADNKDPETRRSITGHALRQGNSTVNWGTRKQKCVTLSTSESEFIAACHATTNMIWLNRLVDQLTGVHSLSTLHVDNQSAIAWIKNGSFQARSKLIDIKYKFIMEKYESKDLRVEYKPLKTQITDIFTKPLSKSQLEMLREKMGIMNLTQRAITCQS